MANALEAERHTKALSEAKEAILSTIRSLAPKPAMAPAVRDLAQAYSHLNNPE